MNVFAVQLGSQLLLSRLLVADKSDDGGIWVLRNLADELELDRRLDLRIG